jgi:hypothetical protein
MGLFFRFTNKDKHFVFLFYYINKKNHVPREKKKEKKRKQIKKNQSIKMTYLLTPNGETEQVEK